jgi:hypothetical protein
MFLSAAAKATPLSAKRGELDVPVGQFRAAPAQMTALGPGLSRRWSAKAGSCLRRSGPSTPPIRGTTHERLTVSFVR